MPKVAYKPLCDAVYQGNAGRLSELAKADPEAAQHWKPIMDAAFVGNAACIDVLAENGADVNVIAGTGAKHTPLTRLCQYHRTIPKRDGHATALKRLLALGANPSTRAGPLALTPVCYAAMGPLQNLVAQLVNELHPLDVWTAGVLYDLSTLQARLSDQDPTVTDEKGRSLLHYVALSGFYKAGRRSKAIECVDFLLASGVDVNAVQPIEEGHGVFNATALWYTVSWQRNAELTAHLLARGADPNPGVFAALWSSNLPICELLAEHRADWNQREGGATPLMELMRYNRTKMVHWLLARDVDLSIKDRDGLTALDYARKRKVRKDIIDLLIDKGARVGTDE